uniref:Putative peptidase n=1 Tax=viral metagenome TaxID=1070528 RepID=A0A6M3JV49_9ZZZZ
MGIALDKIRKIKVVEFDWLDGTHDIGIIAEELVKIIPEAVWYKDGKIEGIKPLTMIALLVKSLQELKE